MKAVLIATGQTVTITGYVFDGREPLAIFLAADGSLNYGALPSLRGPVSSGDAIRDRLQQQLDKLFDGNCTAFARRIGESQQSAANFINGRVRKPRYW